MTARVLAVVERDDPNPALVRYNDILFFCVGVRAQFGSVDVVLRGTAVTCALDDRAAPGAADGDPEATAGGSPSTHRYLRTLIRTGSTVWADEADLAHLPGAAVLDGIEVVDTDALAVRWHDYREVWFL